MENFFLIGLGNFSESNLYKDTRHNVGFQFIDYFSLYFKFPPFKKENKMEISSKKIKINQNEINLFLIKPMCSINISGETIYSFFKKEKNFPELISNFIIIYDDICTKIGYFKLREKGSHGGHNGFKNIIEKLGSGIKRLKIGIDYDKNFDLSD
jgi:PTH1 family peptidyl-tRNA hydrolase